MTEEMWLPNVYNGYLRKDEKYSYTCTFNFYLENIKGCLTDENDQNNFTTAIYVKI